MNSVTLVGRLAGDVELRQTPQGTDVASFAVAVDRDYTGANGQREADFINIVAWRQSAQFAAKYFRKGSPIAVTGRLQTRKYQDKSGANRVAVEVVASQIGFVPAPVGWRQGGGQTPPAQSGSFAPAAGIPAAYQQTAFPGTGQSHQAQAAYTAGAWAQGSAEDFAPITDPEDLPF